MTIFKLALRFCAGYLVGGLVVLCTMLVFGDALVNAARLTLLWAPIAFAYGVLTVTMLRVINMARLTLSLAICGFCVGMFPLVSGLWPTYWMRFDLAIRICGLQLSILTAVMLLRYFVHRIRMRASLSSKSSVP